MALATEFEGTRPVWFVGSAFSGYDDQTERFLRERVWEGGPVEQWGDLIDSIQPGDRIVMKSSYTRRHELPFDNRGYSVSVMAIKAIGFVVENAGDGRNLKVDWTPIDPIREWYFYTNRRTVWRVEPGNWSTDGLIGFAFDNQPQDLATFRNDPYRRDRFGDVENVDHRFSWVEFYMEFADRLLAHRDNREPLVRTVVNLVQERGLPFPIEDQFPDSSTGPLRDIDPFTAMGMFNRAVRYETRTTIAKELAQFLEVEEPPPTAFGGIPTLMAQNSWHFSYSKDRADDVMDTLWQAFVDGIELADHDDDEAKTAFVRSYDAAMRLPGVALAKLTMGLFRARPWFYPSLDGKSVSFVENKLKTPVSDYGPTTGAGYLELRDTLTKLFEVPDFQVHSFPELAAVADDAMPSVLPESHPLIELYDVGDILADGCFLDRSTLVTILQRLQSKQNIILQGPPGAGKTWLSRRAL